MRTTSILVLMLGGLFAFQANAQEPKPVKEGDISKIADLALMKMMDGYRKKLPPPEGLNEMNGRGTPDVDGKVHPDSHLHGIAIRMRVKTKAECMVLLTYLKDKKVSIRYIAAFALENILNAYPNGLSGDALDNLDSDAHRKMVQAFVAGIEKLPK